MGTTTAPVDLPHSRKMGIRPGQTLVRLSLAVAFCATAVAAMDAVYGGTAAVPAAITSVYDGRYGGPLKATFEGRAGECLRLPALSGLIVEGNRAWVTDQGVVLRGTVNTDGRVVLNGALNGPAMLTGQFEERHFFGELRGWNCTHAVELVRE